MSNRAKSACIVFCVMTLFTMLFLVFYNAERRSLKDELFHSHEIIHCHPPKEFSKGFFVEHDELYHTHEEE